MSILLLSNSSKVGGGNRSLLLLNHGLRACGVEARVVVPAEGAMADACVAESVPFEIAPIDEPSWRRPDQLWRSYRRWGRILADSEADLVHANDVTTARSIAIAAWRASVPVVCHVRFPVGRDVIEWTLRRLPKPAAFIFNSRALRAECGPDFERACPSARQFVIHNAVDIDRFRPGQSSGSRPRVGILANLIPIKGHEDFLKMARILTDAGAEADYWIIGEDIHNTGYRAALEKQCRESGLSETVEFLGHRSDVPELLSQLDVLVCASHVEPFGRCLIEAMACEKPVVATRVGGIPEVIEDGVTGTLVAPKSPEELAGAVGRLLSDSALAARMGAAGRRRVEQHFTPEAHVNAVLEVYASVRHAEARVASFG